MSFYDNQSEVHIVYEIISQSTLLELRLSNYCKLHAVTFCFWYQLYYQRGIEIKMSLDVLKAYMIN